MARNNLTSKDRRLVDRLVVKYERSKEHVSLFLDQLLIALRDSSELSLQTHSLKTRLKDPEHLRNKLYRKLIESRVNKKAFGITVDNLLTEVNDLAGVRLLHLYTEQIREINRSILKILHEQKYELIEGPLARTWDDESRSFFRACDIQTQTSPSLYTSVHYVVGSASRTRVTCEIQVRTLMEEVWGEVSHTINYPTPARSLACQEQIKVLARVTSSATRLVDSIFRTVAETKPRSSRQGQPRRAGEP